MPFRDKRHRNQAKATGNGTNPGNPPSELGEDHGKQNNFMVIFYTI